MKLSCRFSRFSGCFSLILVLLIARPVSGQQNTTLPVIKLVSPTITDSLNNSGLAKMSVEVISPVQLLHFTIYNNNEISATEATLKLQKKEDNKYTVESLVPLNKGLNTIHVEVKNAYGTVSSEKRTIRSQFEPFITWTYPSSAQVSVDSAYFTIKAQIRSDLDPQNINIISNGTTITINKSLLTRIDNTTWSLEKTLELSPGKNNLIISAENIKGKSKSVSRILNYGAVPVIAIDSPSSSDTINNSGLVTFRAIIKSTVSLQSFSIYCNEVLALNQSTTKLKQIENNKYIIECLIPLNARINALYIVAKNSIGTSISEKRFVESHPEPFVNWITPVSSPSTFESAAVNIRAEIRSDIEMKDVSLNLNGISLITDKKEIVQQNNSTYILEKTIHLSEGKNNLYLSAENLRGKTKSLPRVINFGSAPVITLKNPVPADSLNNSGLVLLNADVTSASALQSLAVYDNDVLVVPKVKAFNVENVTNKYSAECFVQLYTGQNEIYLLAKNSMGTTVSDMRYIWSQPEPFITWTFPPVTNWVTEQGIIKLKAEVRSDLELGNILINLNGNPIIVDKSEITQLNKNTYSIEKPIQLNKDKNTVFINAINPKGNTRSIERYIAIMSSAPLFTITSPAPEDTLNNSGLVLISAEIKSASALQEIRIFNNKIPVSGENSVKPEQKDSVTYIVKSLVPLQAGKNVLYVDAKNPNGRAASERRIITCRLEPIIRWISPAATSTTTGSGSMRIKAEIKTNLFLLKTGVSINGVMVTTEKSDLTAVNNDTYILEKDITLSNGNNTIELKAENAKGSGYSASSTVQYLPETRSEIKWVMPADLNTETYKPECSLSATIKTRSKISKTTLKLNGTEVLSGNSSKTSVISPEEFSYENTLILKPGINNIDISVLTDAGTISSEKRVIKYNLPPIPSFVWNSPSDDKHVVSDQSVEISMAITSVVNLEKISLYLNGREIDDNGISKAIKKENDNFVFTNKITLRPGDNSIYLTAKNTAGTATSKTRAIKYIVPEPIKTKPETVVTKPETVVAKPETIVPKTEIPLITWMSPSGERNNVTDFSVRIKARINSTEKLQDVMVYVNGTGINAANEITESGPPSSYFLEKAISLNPGENNIYIVATNSTGTVKSDIRYLTNPPTTKPEITWAIPSNANSIVNSELVMVEACIKSATSLKSAQIFVNGVQMADETVFQPPQQGECNFRLTKPVILKEGDNSVIIFATNFAGSKNSDPRVIKYQKTLVAEKRLALVFGNANYSSGELKNPVHDADLMEATLKTLGFDVIKKINSSKAEMESAIREFSEKLPEYNVALFYYAGHGVQINGQNYLIPIDAVLNKQTDCQWEAVEVNRITQQFEQVPENTNIIILDACRNNPFRSWARGGAQGFKALGTVRGTFIAYATSEGSTAADGSGLNGIYTEELVKQMGIPQPIENVFKRTRKSVMERSSGQQIPTEWSFLTGDFYFKK